MQGQILGGSTIRISWGRSSTSRAAVNAAAAAATPMGAFAALPGMGAAPTGASAYGVGAFDLAGYGGYNSTAPTATADPYSAYYATMAQNDPSYQVLIPLTAFCVQQGLQANRP